MQEAGGWAGDPAPSSKTNPTASCSPNLGGSLADPGFDNPSFTILNTTDFSKSPALALTILLEAWPINSYPYVIALPSGSTLVIAGECDPSLSAVTLSSILLFFFEKTPGYPLPFLSNHSW